MLGNDSVSKVGLPAGRPLLSTANGHTRQALFSLHNTFFGMLRPNLIGLAEFCGMLLIPLPPRAGSLHTSRPKKKAAARHR